jgi:hypothetical protein
VIASERPRRRFPARLLALVGALVMIVAAVVVRVAVIEDDDEGTSVDVGGGGGDLRVICATELRAACDALADDADVTVEPAGETEARLAAASAGDDPGVDVWITFAPSAQIVRDTRERARLDPVLGPDVGPVARTPLVVTARRDRAAVLERHCGEVTWTCIGDVAGQPWEEIGGQPAWGVVRPAHREPVGSATGLLVLGHAVGSFLATPERGADDVSRLDWETNDAFPAWFQRLEQSVPDDAFQPRRDPFAQWLQLRGIGYDVVGTTEAEAVPGIARARDLRDDATVLYPAPMATADVVLAPVGDAAEDATRIRERVSDALANASYRVAGAAGPDPAAPSLPDTDGLPAAGALDALRGLWQDVVR